MIDLSKLAEPGSIEQSLVDKIDLKLEIAPRKDDGSVYKMIRFPKAGCWVSYLRTSGDSPMTIVTMQKLQP